MSSESANTINLLLQLGKIGTRVQVLKESGDLVPDQLFFKSLQDMLLKWSPQQRKHMLITPYILVLPGKLTGLLYCAPALDNIPHDLCLGLVCKDCVLELIFQNSRDRGIWSRGLSLLVSTSNRASIQYNSPLKSSALTTHNSCSASHRSLPSVSEYFVDEEQASPCKEALQWTDLTNEVQHNIRVFYSFLPHSYKGAVFLQYQQKRLKLPHKVRVRLDLLGKELQCVDAKQRVSARIPFDADIEIAVPDRSKKTDSDLFRRVPSSIHCFSVIHKTQSLHLGCQDVSLFNEWKAGLEYLSDAVHHEARMKVRRAVIAGTLMLSGDELVETPTSPSSSSNSVKKKMAGYSGKEESSSSQSRSSGFWGSLFY